MNENENTKTQAAPDVKVSAAQLEAATKESASLRSLLESREEKILSLAGLVEEREATLARLRTEAAEASTKTASLDAQLKEARNTINALRDERESLSRRRDELEAKLARQENARLSEQVTQIVGDAIDRGIRASLFEGVENDPAGWMRERYASLDAFRSLVEALPTSGNSKKTDTPKASRSGYDAASAAKDNPSDDAALGLSAEEVEAAKAAGINLSFAGVKNAAEAKALLDKRAREAKASDSND